MSDFKTGTAAAANSGDARADGLDEMERARFDSPRGVAMETPARKWGFSLLPFAEASNATQVDEFGCEPTKG